MNERLRNLLETLRIVGTREVGGNIYEVCANGRASFDDETHRLEVALDSFVRRFEMRGKDEVLKPPWLPRQDNVKTEVSLDEAPDAAKEIFDAWTRKVRGSIPASSEWNAEAEWLHGCESAQK